MNKKTFSTLTLAALLLTACQNDEETMQTDTRVALQVTSGIQTRAYVTNGKKRMTSASSASLRKMLPHRHTPMYGM